ncbi:MAG TPA: hypothetical protein VFW02_07600 [Candidatus Limnocylindrales bacterium]|nr:hypothetical protein [Candidatus Limnocylindrales bacterium]
MTAAAASWFGPWTRMVEVIRIDLDGTPSADTVDRIRRTGSWPVGIRADVSGLRILGLETWPRSNPDVDGAGPKAHTGAERGHARRDRIL